jgi:hypothetical protein
VTTKPYGDAFAEEILTRVARLAWAEYRELRRLCPGSTWSRLCGCDRGPRKCRRLCHATEVGLTPPETRTRAATSQCRNV